MYEVYFTRRLLEALDLADEAKNAEERSAYLRASRYYRDLLDSPEKRHAVRHSVRLSGMLHHASPWPRPVTVCDLSTSGFRVNLPENIKAGTLVALQLDGLAPIDAYIVWQKDGEAGCKFLNELHPALLDAALAVSPRLH